MNQDRKDGFRKPTLPDWDCLRRYDACLKRVRIVDGRHRSSDPSAAARYPARPCAILLRSTRITLMPPKTRLHCCTWLLSALLMLPLWHSAHAWSAKGHRIVAELAERRLTPATATAVRELLQDEASPRLAVIAPWADQVRDLPRYRTTARLHFINFSRNDPCHYVAERDCPDGQCIVAAIAHYRRVLRDRRASIPARAEALKFVVHFVADIHQPLHSAFGDDRGANTFQVRYGFQGLNLHALFDRVLLESRPWRAEEYADFLQSGLPRPGRVTGINPAIHWAESACRLVESEHIYPPRRRVEEAYVLRMRPLAEHQLQLAGVRLAAILNADLGTP